MNDQHDETIDLPWWNQPYVKSVSLRQFDGVDGSGWEPVFDIDVEALETKQREFEAWLARRKMPMHEFRARCAEKGAPYGLNADDVLTACVASRDFAESDPWPALARAHDDDTRVHAALEAWVLHIDTRGFKTRGRAVTFDADVLPREVVRARRDAIRKRAAQYRLDAQSSLNKRLDAIGSDVTFIADEHTSVAIERCRTWQQKALHSLLKDWPKLLLRLLGFWRG